MLFRSSTSVPDELVIVEEGSIFDQTEALLHPVYKRLDFQVGHLVQREETDAPKHIQEVTRLQVQSLQILEIQRNYKHTHRQTEGCIHTHTITHTITHTVRRGVSFPCANDAVNTLDKGRKDSYNLLKLRSHQTES